MINNQFVGRKAMWINMAKRTKGLGTMRRRRDGRWEGRWREKKELRSGLNFEVAVSGCRKNLGHRPACWNALWSNCGQWEGLHQKICCNCVWNAIIKNNILFSKIEFDHIISAADTCTAAERKNIWSDYYHIAKIKYQEQYDSITKCVLTSQE